MKLSKLFKSKRFNRIYKGLKDRPECKLHALLTHSAFAEFPERTVAAVNTTAQSHYIVSARKKDTLLFRAICDRAMAALVDVSKLPEGGSPHLFSVERSYHLLGGYSEVLSGGAYYINVELTTKRGVAKVDLPVFFKVYYAETGELKIDVLPATVPTTGEDYIELDDVGPEHDICHVRLNTQGNDLHWVDWKNLNDSSVMYGDLGKAALCAHIESFYDLKAMQVTTGNRMVQYAIRDYVFKHSGFKETKYGECMELVLDDGKVLTYPIEFHGSQLVVTSREEVKVLDREPLTFITELLGPKYPLPIPNTGPIASKPGTLDIISRV